MQAPSSEPHSLDCLAQLCARIQIWDIEDAGSLLVLPINQEIGGFNVALVFRVLGGQPSTSPASSTKDWVDSNRAPRVVSRATPV